MATEGVVAVVAQEKHVEEETGELSSSQHPGPLKLEKELSGSLADNAVSEIDDKIKVDLLNGTEKRDMGNIDCEALMRTNQSISQDPSRECKAVQSIYQGNSGTSESEDFTKSPLNSQISLDERISEGLSARLDEEKPFHTEKEKVKSDTSCQNDNIGDMEKKDKSTEREHSSETNEKETCDATLARQTTAEWSSEKEEEDKEAKLQYEETLELASRQQIIRNNLEEVPPLSVKGLDCLNLQKEELGNEIAFSKDSREVEVCNKLTVFEINKEASNRQIDQKCEKIVHESCFTAERMVKDDEKKLEGYSYVQSEEIGYAASKTTKDEYDTAQENEAEVHPSVFSPPTLQQPPSNPLKVELRSYDTDQASNMDQKETVDILAHAIAMQPKYEDCSLPDDATQEKNNFSDIKEKNKKSDELQEEQNASDSISDSMASYVTNLPSVENKKTDTEEETIQKDGAIQQTGIEETGTNNGFKLNIGLSAKDERTITKIITEDEKVEYGLNLATETKQPETIGANDEILNSDKDAGERIHDVHHFVSKTEGRLRNLQCPTVVALQNDQWQKVEVKELTEPLPDEKNLASTAMGKTMLRADTRDQTFQCDGIVEELQAAPQGKEENESVTVILLTEVEHERVQEISSTACKEVDGNTVEDKKKQTTSDIELYAEDLSKTDKELDMETENSQDRDLCKDYKLRDGNIIKSIDAERTKEKTRVQRDETAEIHEEQSSGENQEIMTLDHGSLNENTTIFHTSSSAESAGEKCPLDKHQQNEKTLEIIHKEDKFYKGKDIDEVDSKADEFKSLQGSDSHSEKSLKQTDADCEPSQTETQQDVGLIESSAREKVNEGVPMSNTGKCKDTEQVNLAACEEKEGDHQKHDNHPKTLSLGDEVSERHTSTEKEHIYKEPSCSKQEVETGSDKHKEERGDLITGFQESKKANDDPDKNNIFLPVTYESVRKTMEEEDHILHKEVSRSDTREVIHETTNTNMTLRTGHENNEKSPVEPQPTFERTEEDECISTVPLKEQSEPETDQKASSTVSKDMGKITDEDGQNKVYPETELCAQDILEDDRAVTVHDGEISETSEHLPFNEDVTTLAADEVLKIATEKKFETSSSVQFPEDECLLYEHQENEKVAATSEARQQEYEPHKEMNLYEVDSQNKKCNMLPIVVPQAGRTSENIGPDYGQYHADAQEDCKVTIIEYSERVKMNQEALKSNAEDKEHIEGNDEGILKAGILSNETDGQMLDNHQEPLSLGDDAAGGGMYNIYKESKCSEILDIISHEGKGEGDMLGEEAGKQVLNNYERSNSKQDNSSEETKNTLTEDTKEVTVPEQDNKRADDEKVTNEEPIDDSNAHFNITNELVGETAKQALNHQEINKQDNLSEDIKTALTEATKEGTVSEPENERTEDLKKTNEKQMDDRTIDSSVTNELVEEAGKQTLDNQESSNHDNLSEKTKIALTKETKEVTVPEMTTRTDNLKETNDEYMGESNTHLSVTNESIKEAVKESLDNQESSKHNNLSEETKTALTKETKEVSVPKHENNRTVDIKQTNEQYADESDTYISVIDELVEEAVKQTLDSQENSKEDKLSQKTEKEFTEDTKEVAAAKQENKRIDDIKLTKEKRMDGSSAHLNVSNELVEEAGKRTLDNESSEKDILSDETQNALRGDTKVVTVSEQENDLKETNEEYTDESDTHSSVINELDDEVLKKTLDNQERSNQCKLSEETQNALAEETKEVKVSKQSMSTDDVKETNAHTYDINVTDDLIGEAVKQPLDNQSSKQDNLSEETKDAPIEETKEVKIPKQEERTDDVKVTIKQTCGNQESSKQDQLSEETQNACMEGIKELTIPEQPNKKTDDFKETNEEHKDQSNAHLTLTDELIEQTLEEAGTMQKETGPNRKQVIHESTNNHLAVETKSFHTGPQFCKDTDGYKEGNFKAVAKRDEDHEQLPSEEAAASVETCTKKEDTCKELNFSKLTERNNQEEEADKRQEKANDAQSDKDHEPLRFGDGAVSGRTCTEKADTCKELDSDLDCSKIIETDTQEEKEEKKEKADMLPEEVNGQPTEDQEIFNIENLDSKTENAHVNEEKNQDIFNLKQEKKRINDLKEECMTDEDNPDKSNALSPETHEPDEKTQNEEDTLQKESLTFNIEETNHETPDIHMTPGSMDENHEIPLLGLQATYRRVEEDKSTSYGHLKEEYESSGDQEDSTTVSKDITGNTYRATQSETCPEDTLCTQAISKDNNEPDVQEEKAVLLLEQLTFDKNQEIVASADVELLKEGTPDAGKYETSSPIQSTEDKGLLNERQENKKPAVTAKIIQKKDQSHKDMEIELYEGDSHAKKCHNLCVPDSQAERRSDKIGSEYEASPADSQEYDSLDTTESSEKEEFNREAPKLSTDECEHIADNDNKNLKAVTQSDERDEQKLHNHHETFSFDVNAVGNKEMGGSSSSQEIIDDSLCLILHKSGDNIYPKSHTEDIKENISEKEASTKVHEVASTREVNEEMLQDEESREKGQEEEKEEETPQECEPTSNTANEIPIGQIKESVHKQSRHTPYAMDSEESVKDTSLDMVRDETENSTQILPEGLGLSHEPVSGVKQRIQVELGETGGKESIDEVEGIGTTTADSETSEESVKDTSLEIVGDEMENSTQILPEGLGLSHEAASGVKQRKHVELGEAGGKESIDEVEGIGTTTADSDTSVRVIHAEDGEYESCSVLKEQSTENTKKQKLKLNAIQVEETELYPVSNSICENKEIKKTTYDSTSMDNQLSADTDVAAEQITSQEIDEEFVISKVNSKSSASDDISSAGISDEAKDIKMASANLSSTNVLDTANAKEESSNSAALTSLGEDVKQEGHEEEQTQEFNLISNKKTKKTINSNEDNESNRELLEHQDETVDLSEEIDTAGYWDKGKNKSPTPELPADCTMMTEVSNKFEKSYDTPIEALKDEDTKDKLFQGIPSCTIPMEVSEPTADNKKEKEEKGFVRSILYNETTAEDVSLQKAGEFDKKSVTSSEKTESNEGRQGSMSHEVYALTASEVPDSMACIKDAAQPLDTSILVLNKQNENADSQEIAMCENQPALPPCKQVSVAEKLATRGREVMKTTEDESHDVANFETLQNDRDKEMDVSYLPVSQYLIDRIMREEDEKTQIAVQEGLKDGHGGVDIMTKELDISSDKHERLEEYVLQNIDGEPKSKVSTLPAVMETSVEDTKKEVFLSEKLIDIVPKDEEKHATIENNEIESELKNGESTGLGPRILEKSDSQAGVMEENITLNDNKVLSKYLDSPSVAEIDSNKIQDRKCPKYVEAIKIQPNVQMLEVMEEKITLNDNKVLSKNLDSLSVAEIDNNKIPDRKYPKYVEARTMQPNIQMPEEMEQKITLNDNRAHTKNPDSTSATEIDNNKIQQEDNCSTHAEDREIQHNIQMLEIAMIEEHPSETMVIGIHENLLKTQEPPRPVLEVNQVLEDSLELRADIKEVRILENKHDGICDAQVEGSIEKIKLSNLGEAHPSGSEKDPINHNNQVAGSILEEKSLATNRDDLTEEVIDSQAGFDESKNFNGTDETLLQTREPSTPVQEVNQVVQDALEFTPAEKEMKTQMDDKTDGIADPQLDSTVEEPNKSAKLSNKQHPPESEEDSPDYHIQIAEGTPQEKNLAINRDELDKGPIHTRCDEDTNDEEVEKDAEENEIDKSGADTPMTVETRDEGPKTAHKKPHNILSGMKSKVKHSIAKVKKAITGKSSHPKTAPAK